MKRAFMTGVAAGALLAGVSIAAAQGTMGQQPGGAGGGGATEQKSGSGAQQQQKGQDAQKQGDQQKGQDAQKQGDQKKQDAQKQGDQKKQDAQKQGDQKKQDTQKQGDQKKQDTQKQGDQKKQDAQKQGDQKGDAKSGGGGKALSTEQKTRVRETIIRSSNAPRVTNVNFSVSIGTAIPRTVRIAPLPPLLVEIYPDWRRYHYVIVEERIIIIDESSYQIIAIVDV